jgi:hypothetical protein
VRPPALDPQGLAIRESRDSTIIRQQSDIISLDFTGSMDRVVRGIHGDLPKLTSCCSGQTNPAPADSFRRGR